MREEISGYKVIEDNSTGIEMSKQSYVIEMPCEKCNEMYIEKHFNQYGVPADHGYVCDNCREALHILRQRKDVAEELIRRNWIKERDRVLK